MKTAWIRAGVVTALLLCGLPALAQKEKRPDISGFAFITGPKGDMPRVPGLNAVLLFTDEQKEKLVAARQETIGSEAVVSAGKNVKGNPNATEAEKQAAKKAVEDARAQFEQRVAAILTPQQKELIVRLQVIYGQAREAVSAEYGNQFADAKGNEELSAKLRKESQDKLLAEMTRRVNEILNAEQRAAFEKAAAEEKQRAEAAAKGKGK